MFPHPYTTCLLQDQRNVELLREAANARLIEAAISADPVVAKPSSVGRVWAAARQVLAALAGISFTPDSNRPAAA
jgi:hypothetical protein